MPWVVGTSTFRENSSQILEFSAPSVTNPIHTASCLRQAKSAYPDATMGVRTHSWDPKPSIAYGNSITNIRRSVFNWWIQQTSREKPRTAETVTVARYDTSVQKMLEAPPNSNKATHLHLITCSWLPLTPCDVKTIGSQKPSPPAPPQKKRILIMAL